MSPSGTRSGFIPARRPLVRAISAAALVAFAVTIAPLNAVAAACSMACCTQQVISVPQSAACAEECGIDTNRGSAQRPDAVAPAPKPLSSIATLTSSVTVEAVPPLCPARTSARSLDLHRAGPGDPPLFVYNSAFLI